MISSSASIHSEVSRGLRSSGASTLTLSMGVQLQGNGFGEEWASWEWDVWPSHCRSHQLGVLDLFWFQRVGCSISRSAWDAGHIICQGSDSLQCRHLDPNIDSRTLSQALS